VQLPVRLVTSLQCSRRAPGRPTAGRLERPLRPAQIPHRAVPAQHRPREEDRGHGGGRDREGPRVRLQRDRRQQPHQVEGEQCHAEGVPVAPEARQIGLQEHHHDEQRQPGRPVRGQPDAEQLRQREGRQIAREVTVQLTGRGTGNYQPGQQPEQPSEHQPEQGRQPEGRGHEVPGRQARDQPDQRPPPHLRPPPAGIAHAEPVRYRPHSCHHRAVTSADSRVPVRLL
jgi:hypothetical protein